MIKIVIADDHQMFADGLRSILETEADMQVVGTAQNGRKLLQLLDAIDTDVVIMDVSMPDMDGIDATRELAKTHPEVSVLGLSMHTDRHFISSMLRAGALGYVLKNTGKQELVLGIRKVYEGETYLSEEVSKTLLDGFMRKRDEQPSERMSAREREVLEKIAEGLTTQEIADKLFISKNTVETHRKNLLFKFSAKNTAELVNITFRKGLIK